MAKLIKVKNPALPQKEDTFLTEYNPGDNTLTVKNNQGFSSNDIVVVGHPGYEKTEQAVVSSTTGDTTITLSGALKFSHGIDTPVYKYDYNQISLERKPSAGAFAEIAEGKVNIQWDERDGYTKIQVAAGLDSDTYKWRFYNTSSTAYSDYSAELPGGGLSFYHAGFLVSAVREFAKIPANAGVSDKFIMAALNRGQRKVDTMHDLWWFSKTIDTDATRVQSEADVYKYDLPNGFRAMDVVQVLDENDRRYDLDYVPRVVFDSLKQNNADTATHTSNTSQWTLLEPDSDNYNGYFGVHPTPDDDTLYFYRRYYQYLPELTTFASRTLIPLPEILFDYALYEIYRIREDRENASDHLGFFKDGVNLMKRVQRRQAGQAQLLHFRGQRGFADLFGGLTNLDADTMRELYW